MRRAWDLVESLLLLAAAWYWFGSSGVGLLLLWWQRPGTAEVPEPGRFLRALPGLIWMSEQRILLLCRRQGRLVLYRDEVSDAQWSAVRRALLASEPADGG